MTYNYWYLLRHFWHFSFSVRRLLIQTPFFVFCINNGFKDTYTDRLLWDINFGFVKIKREYFEYEELVNCWKLTLAILDFRHIR